MAGGWPLKRGRGGLEIGGAHVITVELTAFSFRNVGTAEHKMFSDARVLFK